MNKLREQIFEMKDYCKHNNYCADKDGNVTCPYREMCIDFLKNSELSYTPLKEPINKMYNVLGSLQKYKVIKPKQKFINSKGKYSVRNSRAGYYWRNLKYIYCLKKGCTIKHTWLDFQVFAEYYNIMSCDGKYIPRIKKGVEYIDEKAIDWVVDK